jgi:hypothetical protein
MPIIVFKWLASGLPIFTKEPQVQPIGIELYDFIYKKMDFNHLKY